jgi:hypothetical protein
MDRAANRHSYLHRHKPGCLRDRWGVQLNSLVVGMGADRSNLTGAAAGQPMVSIDNASEEALAADIIEVHGASAAAVARDNARSAARAAQIPQAKSWISVLGIIQRIQTQRQGKPPPSPPASKSTEGS